MKAAHGAPGSHKQPGALRTIGEVSALLGLRQHVLRYWETQFPMLQPVKRSGSRRYYRPEDIALLRRIDDLVHREGYTLRGASQLLEQDASGGEAQRLSNSSEDSGLNSDDSMRKTLSKIREKLRSALEAG
ncbi:MerR family transcriptional regulator [Novosphingobium decolorationis]|uniref:MerR family transcriptional regulator n=1 Tax=Novosphingobium decolorationis TaxID=2698673 RepID=A0ABX8EAR3_9SPHN|nr:MerR family transcriptional regulator [Novosphingobium decolorationis]QVM85990.1 MerR family transcriptional regulator [Novosphingobium decolorationis]